MTRRLTSVLPRSVLAALNDELTKLPNAHQVRVALARRLAGQIDDDEVKPYELAHLARELRCVLTELDAGVALAADSPLEAIIERRRKRRSGVLNSRP